MLFFFFFSSRRRHTRYWRDWSSDVCSSDLEETIRRAVDVEIDRCDSRTHLPTGPDGVPSELEFTRLNGGDLGDLEAFSVQQPCDLASKHFLRLGLARSRWHV